MIDNIKEITCISCGAKFRVFIDSDKNKCPRCNKEKCYICGKEPSGIQLSTLSSICVDCLYKD